jgi:hypothetical protein
MPPGGADRPAIVAGPRATHLFAFLLLQLEGGVRGEPLRALLQALGKQLVADAVAAKRRAR